MSHKQKLVLHQAPLNVPTTGLVVGLPFGGRPVAPEWAYALAIMTYPTNTNIFYCALKGIETGEARNKMAKYAIEHNAKYLFFLDDDTEPPKHAVRQLINTLAQADDDVMVAGGIYFAKREPTEPIVYQEDGGGPFWKWKVGEVFECASIGTGCMVIKTKVFKHLEEPYFQWTEKREDLPEKMSKISQTDDIYFCQKVRKAGFKIVADAGVICNHWDVTTGQYYTLPKGSYPTKESV